LSVEEYLHAYGFNIEKVDKDHFDENITNKMFDFFTSNKFREHAETISSLRKYRSRGVKMKDYTAELQSLIDAVGMNPKNVNALTSNEVKFLTGEWFEQYVYYGVKSSFELDDDKIMTGVTLNKEVLDRGKKIVEDLLTVDDVQPISPNNELDVIFMYNGRIYILECKSSVITTIENKVVENGQVKTRSKEFNILGETIYKSDSLRTKFGLFANSFIFTMTDFSEYISSANRGEANNRRHNIEGLINRATLSGISIVDGKKLRSEKSIKKIIIPC
jgi:hypothetical protein